MDMSDPGRIQSRPRVSDEAFRAGLRHNREVEVLTTAHRLLAVYYRIPPAGGRALWDDRYLPTSERARWLRVAEEALRDRP